MPTYTYHCDANGKSVLVFHAISTRVRVWSELCLLAGIPPGDTPKNARVSREISGGILLRGRQGHGQKSCCGTPGCA